MSYTAPVAPVGPGTPAGTILRQHWHPVAVAKDLADGTAQPVRLLGEDFTLYRGETGTPHLVGARCPHRGTWLHTGWIEDDCVRCFYHGWKFDQSGACVDQPFEQAGFAAASSIASHHVQEYAGLLFAYIGDDDPPPIPRYPELEREGYAVVASIRPPGAWPVNYFQTLENSVDPVHLSFVHRATQPFARTLPDNLSVERVEGGVALTAQREGKPPRCTRYWFPTLIQLPSVPIPGFDVDCPFFNWKTPIDDHTTLFIASRAVPADLLATIEDPEEMGGRTMPADAAPQLLAGARKPESVTEEDYVAMVGQGTIADRINERLGKSDMGIVELRRLWSERLNAVGADA